MQIRHRAGVIHLKRLAERPVHPGDGVVQGVDIVDIIDAGCGRGLDSMGDDLPVVFRAEMNRLRGVSIAGFYVEDGLVLPVVGSRGYLTEEGHSGARCYGVVAPG